MITEALLYAATLPLTGKPHRKFIRYSVNLWSRAGRCAADWAEHELDFVQNSSGIWICWWRRYAASGQNSAFGSLIFHHLTGVIQFAAVACLASFV